MPASITPSAPTASSIRRSIRSPQRTSTVDGISLGNIQLRTAPAASPSSPIPNGNAQVNLLQQNGYPAGQLQSVAVERQGPDHRHLFERPHGRPRPDHARQLQRRQHACKRIDGGAFQETANSGTPTFDAPGKIVGRSLEGSNTDIADEFTKLIVTQQAYSANTRVITTSNHDGSGSPEHAAIAQVAPDRRNSRNGSAVMSLSQALAAAISGLRVNQTSLTLVAANVANAGTPGYVRKTVDQVATRRQRRRR